jgi:hypothetical protein
MNLSLYRSWFALLALLVVAATVATAWRVGDVADVRWLRLWTGALAVACMLLALGYVLRKYMHRYGYSPEFRLKVPIAQLERAEKRLNELRARIRLQAFRSIGDLHAEVQRVLREEGVHRILAVDVEPGPAGGPAYVLQINKAFLFGRAAKWLHLHVFISVAFAVLVAVHAGRDVGRDLGGVMVVLSAAVVLTGLLGIALWTFGPTWLTRRERDLSIEESFVMKQGFETKLGELRKGLESDPGLVALLDQLASAGRDFQPRVRAALAAAAGYPDERRRLFEDACVLRGQLQRVDLEFRALWRIRTAFMAWRAVHIPCAILLATAVLLHLFAVVRY